MVDEVEWSRIFPLGFVRRWAIVMLLVPLGFWYITNLAGALFIDETIYARTGVGLLTGEPYRNPTHAFAPTAKYLVGLGQVIAGPTSVGIRGPIVVAALATLYATYRLGWVVGNRTTGLLAAGVVGTTHFFADHATMAMLDVPLALSVLLLLLVLLRWLREARPTDAVLLGVLAALTATTKAYGFLYALPIGIVFLSRVSTNSTDLRGVVRSLRRPLAGAIAVLVVIYIPFVLVPPPPVPSSYGPAVQTILTIPIVGNLAYVFGGAVVRNLAHAGGGHAVPVAGVVRVYPPVWTYGYWLASRYGAFYLVGTVVTVLWGINAVRLRKAWSPATVLALSVILPLVGLSLLTVKFPRYILPLIPLTAVGLTAALWTLSDPVLDRFGALTSTRRGGHVPDGGGRTSALPAILVVVVVIALALTPPSPVLASVNDPIRTDTGYDKVVRGIEAYVHDHPEEEVVVLTSSGSIRIAMEYYLDEEANESVEFRNFQLNDGVDRTLAAQLRQDIERGEVRFVVTEDDSEQLREIGFYSFVAEHSTVVRSHERPDGVTLALHLVDSPDRRLSDRERRVIVQRPAH